MPNTVLQSISTRTVALRLVATAILSLLWLGNAAAAPPYDVTVTFTGGSGATSHNLYIDDCAAAGPVGAPFAAVTSGQTFVAALTQDGTYEICVRSVNATGESPDPGPVAAVTVNDLPLPGPVDNLDVAIACPNGGCTVTVTVN